MQRLRWVYLLLIVIRIGFALSPGYIHPDEYFQFGEVLVGDLFGIDTLRTWEFDSAYPCRSMASIRLFGMPFYLLGKRPSTMTLFLTSRTTFLCLSFVLDWSAWQLLPRQERWKGITLLAASGSMMAFSARSFSNNVEASLLALLLVCLLKMRQNRNPYLWTILLGGALSIGFFSRFTFIIFAGPLGFAYAQHTWRRCKDRRSFARATLPAVIAALGVASLHTIHDSIYYSGSLSSLIVAPLNAAMYNMKKENLALHGAHPRWLHMIVNAPMIIGIAPWISFGIGSIQGEHHAPSEASLAIRRVLQRTVLFSIACLSIQPHQEPRFLLPLVMPATVLFASSPLSRNRLLLWAVVLQNIGVAIFFGLLHQAGTIPAMLTMSSQILQTNASTEAFFWRSFMPPRHLLLSPGGGKDIIVSDCQSVSVEDIVGRIQTSSHSKNLLFAPSWVLNEENRAVLFKAGLNLTPTTRAFPHVDTDYIGESIARYHETSSLIDSFSYRAYLIA